VLRNKNPAWAASAATAIKAAPENGALRKKRTSISGSRRRGSTSTSAAAQFARPVAGLQRRDPQHVACQEPQGRVEVTGAERGHVSVGHLGGGWRAEIAGVVGCPLPEGASRCAGDLLADDPHLVGLGDGKVVLVDQ
jgi:hypothetical protein